MNKSIFFACVKLVIVFTLALGTVVPAQTGLERIDPNFNPILSSGLANIAAIAVQPDGKIIVGGMFFHSNFESRNSLTLGSAMTFPFRQITMATVKLMLLYSATVSGINLLSATNNFRVIQSGQSGEVPIESVYVR